MLPSERKELIQHWIKTVLEEGRNLSHRDTSQIQELADQFKQYEALSDQQLAALERLYEEKTA